MGSSVRNRAGLPTAMTGRRARWISGDDPLDAVTPQLTAA